MLHWWIWKVVLGTINITVIVIRFPKNSVLCTRCHRYCVVLSSWQRQRCPGTNPIRMWWAPLWPPISNFCESISVHFTFSPICFTANGNHTYYVILLRNIFDFWKSWNSIPASNHRMWRHRVQIQFNQKMSLDNKFFVLVTEIFIFH